MDKYRILFDNRYGHKFFVHIYYFYNLIPD